MAIKRQSIVDAVETRFKGIKIASGYHTDVGNNVFVYRDADIEAQELPALNIRDYRTKRIDEVTDATSYDNWDLYFEIELVCAAGSLTITQVRQIIADVTKAIGVDQTWGALALFTWLQGDEIFMRQEDKKVGGAIINFYVRYRNTKFQES
jgi:hypothetical protein